MAIKWRLYFLFQKVKLIFTFIFIFIYIGKLWTILINHEWLQFFISYAETGIEELLEDTELIDEEERAKRKLWDGALIWGFYVLSSLNKYSISSVEAGLKYFIFGIFSSGLILFGTLETICRNNSLISNKKDSIAEVGCYEIVILTNLIVRWVNILKLDQNFIVQIIKKRAIFNFI
jgi:hypothetical protein